MNKKIKVGLSAGLISLIAAGGAIFGDNPLNDFQIEGQAIVFTDQSEYETARDKNFKLCKPKNCPYVDRQLFLSYMKHEGKNSSTYKTERDKLLNKCATGECDANDLFAAWDVIGIEGRLDLKNTNFTFSQVRDKVLSSNS